MIYVAYILLLMTFGLLHAWLIGTRMMVVLWLAFLLLSAFFFLAPVTQP